MRAPIFVVGTPRSGTTITAAVLGRHKGLFKANETHFLEDIYSRRAMLGEPDQGVASQRIVHRLETLYRRYNSPAAQTRIDTLLSSAGLRSRLLAAGSYPELLDIFLSAQAEIEGKRRWINKVPRDIFSINLLFSMFPSARIVACIRDPRAFASSYKDASLFAEGETAARVKQLYHPFLTALLWNGSMNVLRQGMARHPDKIFVSRYEDMVQDPEIHFTGLCRFLDEQFDLAMLAVRRRATTSSRAGITTSSVDHWRNRLSQEEIYIVQKVCSRGMLLHGYRPEKTHAAANEIIRHALILAPKTLRALYVNRGRRAPLGSYLKRRIAALFSG